MPLSHSERAAMPKDEKRTKQAQQGARIGQWVVVGGVICIMGLTLADALASAPVLRDLDVVELWAGVGSIASAATRAQYQAATFDLHRVPGVTDMPGESCEDLTTMTGFKAAVSLVLRLREGGLLALGPDCSSFTFPNSSRHKRTSHNAVGDLSYFPVSVGNLMAVIAVFLCQLALARKAHFALENPSDSQFFRFVDEVCPSFWGRGVEAWRLFVQTVTRCAYDDNPEPKIGKLYKWVSSCQGIKGLNARCKCQSAHRRLGFTNSDGTGWTGDYQALGESAAYPRRLGEALLNMWQRHCQPIDADWSRHVLAMEWRDPRSVSQDTELAPEASGGGVKKSRCQVPAPKAANQDQVVSQDLGPWGGSGVVVEQSRHSVRAQDLGPWGASGVGVEKSRSQSLSQKDLGPWASAGSSASASTAYGPWASAGSSTSASTAQGPWSTRVKATNAATPTLGPWASLSISSSSSDDAEAAPGQVGSPR